MSKKESLTNSGGYGRLKAQEGGRMENKAENLTPKSVPFYIHEAECTRLDRIIKRLWILAIILIALLVATNAAWLWYESQYEEVVATLQEVEQENDSGDNTFIGGDYYGETKSSYKNN